MSEKRIVSARITAMPRPMPAGMFDPMPEVWAKFEGETEEQKLFSFYPDEISFSPGEFIGLTRTEAGRLFHRKDVEYLRS